VSATYVGNNLALDFVGTLSERNRTRLEHLRSTADLAEWLQGAGVLDDLSPGDGEELGPALELREALFAVIESLIDRKTLPTGDELAVINAAAAASPPLLSVTPDGHVHRTGGLAAGLSAVARDGIELLHLPDARLKWCADPDCTHPFLDQSRGHRRRWCGMAGCGDRAKAAAYRARRRTQRSVPDDSTPDLGN
jgi:predicted RNA-binding Zn ribbon-like protein